jgi:large subunit ribosomal protein L25
MAQSRTLHAEPRKRTGSGALKRMRREGWLPCVIYGRGVENLNIKVDARTLSGMLVHVDFRAVDESTEIHAHLPVELLGVPAGVKTGGVLEQIHHTLEIRCLPKDLPNLFQADISHMEIGDFLHISDIEMPPGVTAIQPGDVVIAQVAKMRTAAEEETTAAVTEPGAEAGAEPEVVGKAKDED